MKKLCYLLLVLSLASCYFEDSFEEHKDFNGKAWHTDSLVDISLKSIDSLKKHDIDIIIRHNINYEYQNIFIFVYYDNKKDTLELNMANLKGKWLGNGVGNIRKIRYNYKKGVVFKKTKNEKIQIEQAVRYGDEEKIIELLNIESVGIKIITHEN